MSPITKECEVVVDQLFASRSRAADCSRVRMELRTDF